MEVTPEPVEHYPNRAERRADQWIHLIGLGGVAVGGPVLVAVAGIHGGLVRAGAVVVYVACLGGLLAVSAAYNLARSARWQRRLRRLDHAAIFLMIAGSYTPFTTQRLEGLWALVMTVGVWSIALLAAAGKLILPGVTKKVWIAVYVLLGWLVLAAIEPLVASLPLTALVLLVGGGVIYTLGAFLYAWPDLPFRRALWHFFVLAAAGAHYAAILIGVALAA